MNNSYPPPQISVIVITWDSIATLTRCLNCLTAQTLKNFEVVLVDNGSTDGCLDGVESHWPGLTLRVHRLPENAGFAIANNIGARLARGRWLALVNADAFPEPDWLERLLQAAQDHPNFHCFSSRQIQAAAPHILDGAGDAYHVSGLAWPRYMGYPAGKYGLEQMEVFSPCAAAALYLAEAFLKVGGFDEDFFAYYEDVDLGFRLRLYGYRTLYVPQAVVHHVGSVSFGKGSNFAFYHSQRNLVWTFVQNMPFPLFWKYLPAHLMGNLFYMTYYSLRLHSKAICQGKWDAIRGLRRALRKRREIQRHRMVSTAELERVMEHGLMKPYTLNYHLRKATKVANPSGE